MPTPSKYDEPSCDCPGPPPARGLSRRGLLQDAAVAVAAGPPVSTRYAWASTGDYTGDVLVVLSLRGGFDGLSAVVPAADPAYAAARPTVGIPDQSLLALDRTFGLHPALAPLKPLWDAGRFGAVHAVGQPVPSRSHFTAMEELERAAPGSGARTGWLDRTLGLRGTGSAFQAVQVGGTMVPRALSGPSPELAMGSLDRFEVAGAWDDREAARWQAALTGMHAGAPAQLRVPAEAKLAAAQTAASVRATAYVPAGGAVYPKDELGNALRDVARLVKAGVGLQVACIDVDDWDMHAGMGRVESGWMRDKLAAGLVAFATDLGSRLDGVTLVTLSEFGRRVAENGSGGVDHGHGNAVLLLGGGVVGGRVHGSWPGLAPGRLVDGDLAATTDYRLVLGEILQKRCGAGSLTTIFPGLAGTPLGVARERA